MSGGYLRCDHCKCDAVPNRIKVNVNWHSHPFVVCGYCNNTLSIGTRRKMDNQVFAITHIPSEKGVAFEGVSGP